MVSTSLLSFAPRFPVASPVDAHGDLGGRADRPHLLGTFAPLGSGPAALTTVGRPVVASGMDHDREAVMRTWQVSDVLTREVVGNRRTAWVVPDPSSVDRPMPGRAFT
jgi:hypothetical protein